MFRGRQQGHKPQLRREKWDNVFSTVDNVFSTVDNDY